MQVPDSSSSALIGGIEPFGLSLSFGILTGYALLRDYVTRAQLPEPLFVILYIACVPFCFVGSHLFEIFLYQPERLLRDPAILFRLNDGISSFGLIFSGIFFTGSAAFLLKRRALLYQFWDAFALSVLGVLLCVRMGCAWVKDHPGELSTFFLAVPYPDGFRHDLGLYELLFLGVFLLPLVWRMSFRNFPAGTLFSVFCLLYGLFRIFMDELRVIDLRYLGWTPGQYSSLILIVGGSWMLLRARRSKLKTTGI